MAPPLYVSTFVAIPLHTVHAIITTQYSYRVKEADMLDQQTIDQELENLAQHRRRLAHYLLQQAALGMAATSFEITDAIQQCRTQIQETKAVLRSWSVVFHDPTDDQV
jgi:hypothetical protein